MPNAVDPYVKPDVAMEHLELRIAHMDAAIGSDAVAVEVVAKIRKRVDKSNANTTNHTEYLVSMRFTEIEQRRR